MSNSILTFKSNFPTFTILHLHTQDIGAVKIALRDKFKQAPMMFIGMQLIIDLRDFDKVDLTIPIDELKQFLLGEGLNFVAIMSNKKKHRQIAIEQGVGALTIIEMTVARNKNCKQAHKQHLSSSQQKTANLHSADKTSAIDVVRPINTLEDKESLGNLENKFVKHHIRSGQRIYSRGDLIVVGAVSVGAEVIADGNIHIYGTLRGRAIAGARGNEQAHIFCHSLEAELISIAGNYKPNEEIDERYYNKNVQISLENKKICFLEL